MDYSSSAGGLSSFFFQRAGRASPLTATDLNENREYYGRIARLSICDHAAPYIANVVDRDARKVQKDIRRVYATLARTPKLLRRLGLEKALREHRPALAGTIDTVCYAEPPLSAKLRKKIRLLESQRHERLSRLFSEKEPPEAARKRRIDYFVKHHGFSQQRATREVAKLYEALESFANAMIHHSSSRR